MELQKLPRCEETKEKKNKLQNSSNSSKFDISSIVSQLLSKSLEGLVQMTGTDNGNRRRSVPLSKPVNGSAGQFSPWPSFNLPKTAQSGSNAFC